MQPHQLFTDYHTFDLTEAKLHILENPQRIVALVPSAWEAIGDKVATISGTLMQGYKVTAWREVLVKEL